MSVVIYACALVGINFFARIADKTNRRGLPLITASSCALLGYILLLVVTNHKARMAATAILAFGIYATIPISTTWLTLNVAGYTQRGAATAMMNMVAQAFAISGNQAYVDPPFCECAPISSPTSEVVCSLLTVGLLCFCRPSRHRISTWDHSRSHPYMCCLDLDHCASEREEGATERQPHGRGARTKTCRIVGSRWR